MTLITKIKADQLQARKDRNSLKSTILTTLIGEASIIGKNGGNREVTDQEVITVIKKFIKSIDDTLNYLGVASSFTVQYQVVASEKAMLEKYLPSQMTEEELIQAIAEVKFAPKGIIMKFLKDNFAGKYDGKLASKVIDELER